MSTDRERFKVAFLLACAEANLSLEETHALIKNAGVDIPVLGPFIDKALDIAGHGSKKVIDIGANLATTAGKGMLGAAVAAPIVLGAGTGYLMGRSGGLTDEDVTEAKQQELIAAYQNAAHMSRLRQHSMQNRDDRRSKPVRALV